MPRANPKKAVFGALRRTSPELSLVIIVAFTVLLLSTAYFALAFTPAEFKEKSAGYEEDLSEVSVMNDWTRTKYYWANNLSVAGVYAVGTPTYFGFNSLVANHYWIGMSTTYWYHYAEQVDNAGGTGMLAFTGQIFVHGLLELTGFYLIVAVSLRVGWNIWKGMGHLVAMAARGKRLSWKLSKWEKREILKHKRTIKLLLSDFFIILALGAFLIFLAGPIESYVSSWVGSGFYIAPLLAAIYLVIVGLIYAAIVRAGFKAMRDKIKLVWKDLRLARRRKWLPAQLSLMMLVIFLLMMLVRVVLLA